MDLFFDKFSLQWTLEEKVSMAKFECEQMILFATKAGWQTLMIFNVVANHGFESDDIRHAIWYAKDHSIPISTECFYFLQYAFWLLTVTIHIMLFSMFYQFEVLWPAKKNKTAFRQVMIRQNI